MAITFVISKIILLKMIENSMGYKMSIKLFKNIKSTERYGK